jgi:hypothetical protein
MGNVLNFTFRKNGIINQETFSKPSCLTSTKKHNPRYSSAKNFVIKDSQDKVI